MRALVSFASAALLFCSACTAPELVEPEVPQFGFADDRSIKRVAGARADLDIPRDLEFHPDRPDELWVVNRGFDGVVIIFDPGTEDQSTERRKDQFANHFMEEVSTLAFGADDTFASCHESINEYDGMFPGGDDFMGPALWPASLDYFAMVNQDPFGQLGGSHLDMLHQSPLCMGIAHDHDNAYWVFDGKNGHIVYYDFQEPHIMGGDDHSDGIVRRYEGVQVAREPDVPGHLDLDERTGWLYIADTGNGRVLRMDTATGEVSQDLINPFQNNEPLAEFSSMSGVDKGVFVRRGVLEKPSGIAVGEDHLFVSDFATGEIVAFDYNGEEVDRIDTGADGIMGIELGPDGRLWFVDGLSDRVMVVEPGFDAPVEE